MEADVPVRLRAHRASELVDSKEVRAGPTGL
jgi:hypothetical protein